MIERVYRPGARVMVGKCEGIVQDPSRPPARTRVKLDGGWTTDFETKFVHPIDGEPDIVYAIDQATLGRIMEVLQFVSAGRTYANTYPQHYPAIKARALLGDFIDLLDLSIASDDASPTGS